MAVLKDMGGRDGDWDGNGNVILAETRARDEMRSEGLLSLRDCDVRLRLTSRDGQPPGKSNSGREALERFKPSFRK